MEIKIVLFTLFFYFIIFLKEQNFPSCNKYNFEYNSINYKVKKQKLLLENLKKIDVKKPAFDI